MFKIKLSHMLYIILLLFIFLMVCKLCSNKNLFEGATGIQDKSNKDKLIIDNYPTLNDLLQDFNIMNKGITKEFIQEKINAYKISNKSMKAGVDASDMSMAASGAIQPAQVVHSPTDGAGPVAPGDGDVSLPATAGGSGQDTMEGYTGIDADESSVSDENILEGLNFTYDEKLKQIKIFNLGTGMTPDELILQHKDKSDKSDVIDDKHAAMEQFFDIMKEKNNIINVSYIDDINIGQRVNDNHEPYSSTIDNLKEEEIDDYINSENKDSIQFIKMMKKKYLKNKISNQQNLREKALQEIFKNNSYDKCLSNGLPCPMNTPPFGGTWSN